MKKIIDCNDTTIEPENVFLYIPYPGLLFYIYDNNYYYSYSTNYYFSRHIDEDIANNNKIINSLTMDKEIDNSLSSEEGYYLLAYKEPLVPSHNYEFILTYLNAYNLYSKQNITYLVLKTNNAYYNNLINFLRENILPSHSIEYVECDKLYNIKKLHIINYLKNNNHHDAFTQYTSILRDKFASQYISPQKIYHIKFNTNNQFCWTKDRSFCENPYILDILAKYNYKPLDADNEIHKQLMLQNSRYGILSWGGNMHINLDMSSYNQQKFFLILCHQSYEHEYQDLVFQNNICDTIRCGNFVRYIQNIDFNNFDNIILDFENKYLHTI